MNGHHHDHSHGVGIKHQGNATALKCAFGITVVILVAEAAGGWLTNSLALLSDAGHMLSDAASLGLSLLAMHFAKRPASTSKSYGYRLR